MFLETFRKNAVDTVFSVFDPASRIYILYLLASLVLAYVAYRQLQAHHRHEQALAGHALEPLPGFLGYVFDRKIWSHPSTRQDVIYFLINALIFEGLIAQFLISAHTITTSMHGVLVAWFGARDSAVMDSAFAITAYTVAGLLIADLAVFLMHWLMHKNPVLWHFHKVHHSAEALNPMTVFRLHPVELFLTALVTAVFIGTGMAGLFYLTNVPPEQFTIFGLNVGLFLFYLVGYNLRHSHIWLNYPVWLSRILISPAQHQIHHSTDPRHFDRNYGLLFAFWDWIFGSLYIPRAYEKLQYGLDRQTPNPFKSVSDLYVKPLAWAGETLRVMIDDRRRRSMVYCGFGVLLVAYSGLFWGANAPSSKFKYGPRLEDMTWVELHDAIKGGFDSVIIPTGGTEQNGPFVALGKHNFILERTAPEIARRVGHTLVAPVLPYVPEGQIDPPEGHMTYPGTLSLPEPVFEAVLEATARSLKTHGFKNIFILGEHGDSQDAQVRVVKKLAAEWRGTDVRIADINDYYFGNGQVEALLAQGFTKREIGIHAGLRDASELMYVSPDRAFLRHVDLPPGRQSGIDGWGGRASASIGKTMIALKIEAGTKQIRKLLEDWGRSGRRKRDVASASSPLATLKP